MNSFISLFINDTIKSYYNNKNEKMKGVSLGFIIRMIEYVFEFQILSSYIFKQNYTMYNITRYLPIVLMKFLSSLMESLNQKSTKEYHDELLEHIDNTSKQNDRLLYKNDELLKHIDDLSYKNNKLIKHIDHTLNENKSLHNNTNNVSNENLELKKLILQLKTQNAHYFSELRRMENKNTKLIMLLHNDNKQIRDDMYNINIRRRYRNMIDED